MCNSNPSLETNKRPPLTIRWWPAAVILSGSASVWAFIWFFQDVHRQSKNLRSAVLILVTIALLFLWILLFSRLRWTRRLLLCGSVICLVGILGASLEIRGVTGDMLPVIEWRWTKRSSEQLPVNQATIETQNLTLSIDSASDFPQISGPSRTSILPGPQLMQDWKASPPELLWRQAIGAAWSGFAIVGRYAVTLEQRGESELVTCYDLLTGDLIWSHADESHFMSVVAGEGPRSVPTIFDRLVLTLGPNGILNCLDLTDGSKIWSKNIVTENKSKPKSWGISCSPLVVDGKVIVSAGGNSGNSLVAYDIRTGDHVWSSGNDRAGYSSPVLGNIEGVAQTLIFNGPGVKAHDLNSGQILWEYDWERGHPHIVMPVILPEGRVLISSGYGIGSQLVQISLDASGSWNAAKIWKSNRLKSKFANIIVHEGYIFGLDDGIFVCLELESGDLQWKRGRYGHGQTLLVGDLLLVMAENGDLILLEPTPKEHRELTRFSVLSGKTWNPPALAGEYLLVRNDKEAACYRLPTEEP